MARSLSPKSKKPVCTDDAVRILAQVSIGPTEFQRLRRALKQRAKLILNQSAAMRPIAATDISDLDALRTFAVDPVNAESKSVRFNFHVGLPRGYRLPAGPHLRLAHVSRLDFTITDDRLKIDVAFTKEKTGGEVAWAIAQLLQPQLAPYAEVSPDVVADDPALAMGARLHFGAFEGSDASEMESVNARYVNDRDREEPYFDLAKYNPIGLRLRELMSTWPLKEVSQAFLSYNDVRHQYAGLNLVRTQDFKPGDIAGLAATGDVVMVDAPVPGLAPELNDIITQPRPKVLDDKDEQSLHWMVRSETQRRAAMLHHAGAFRLSGAWPSVSILLVTNRESMLSHAVAQAIQQTYPNFEIIVGLHGIMREQATLVLQHHAEILGSRLRLVALDESMPPRCRLRTAHQDVRLRISRKV